MNIEKPMGGSELAYYTLANRLSKNWADKINLMLSICDPAHLSPNKVNIIWQQLNWNEESVSLLNDPSFVEKIDFFVWVSHWQYNQFRTKFNIPAYKSITIKNASLPCQFVPRNNTNKLKLIYTSTPWRGLDVLLEAFRLLDRNDIELDVFSSTKIYGPKFEKITEGQFDWLFDVAKNMPGVNYHGYAEHSVVREAVSKSHIFAYPNTFEETSCMSAIEALMAGCKVVTTNLGALPETCNDWATYVSYGPNRNVLASRYATVLENAINTYWTEDTQAHVRAQSEHYNKFWSWDVRIKEWEHFFDLIVNQNS